MRRELLAAGRCLLVVVLALSFSGCGSRSEERSAEAAAPEPAQDEQLTPENLRYVQAAEPFVHAIAGQQYQEAFALLSRRATARMTLNQFDAPPDALMFQRNEQSAFQNVSAATFVELMKRVEELYGLPQSAESLVVFSSDPDVLGRRNQEASGIIESASAIGGMPDSVPPGIRRASLHVEISTVLTPDQLRRAAAEMDVKPEDLEKDTSFKPSCNLKVVLVEEDGRLAVGYFEFLPASRWN